METYYQPNQRNKLRRSFQTFNITVLKYWNKNTHSMLKNPQVATMCYSWRAQGKKKKNTKAVIKNGLNSRLQIMFSTGFAKEWCKFYKKHLKTTWYITQAELVNLFMVYKEKHFIVFFGKSQAIFYDKSAILSRVLRENHLARIN